MHKEMAWPACVNHCENKVSRRSLQNMILTPTKKISRKIVKCVTYFESMKIQSPGKLIMWFFFIFWWNGKNYQEEYQCFYAPPSWKYDTAAVEAPVLCCIALLVCAVLCVGRTRGGCHNVLCVPLRHLTQRSSRVRQEGILLQHKS